jgi:ELWxxDGT repeat protein
MTYRGHEINAIPSELGVLKGKIFFEGFQDDIQHRSALYSYDISSGRTRLVKDIDVHGKDALGYPTEYDDISEFTRLGNSLVFHARSAKGGDEMWITDGTTAGTHQIKDIYVGSSDSSPTDLTFL